MIKLIENVGGSPPPSGYLVKLVESIFKPGGTLQRVLQLDHRPQQSAMALRIAQSLETDQALLIEAGTGVGKSLAYLIPGLMYSIDSERPLIVSSHTITLQEQIRSKDLDLCRQLFDAVPELKRYATFKTALMVGKGNYCCTTRLNHALKDLQADKQTEFLEHNAKTELIRLAKWSATSTNGIVQELSPAPMLEVWEAVNADSSSCSKKNCPPERCFYQRARKHLLSAHCVIVNHSLLFALINAGMRPEGETRGILLPDDLVVLDEAHRIPAIATDHFGIHVSSYAVDRALKRIYNPRTHRGILRRHGQMWDQDAVDHAITAASEFFAYLGDAFLANIRSAAFRKRIVAIISSPNHCNRWPNAWLRSFNRVTTHVYRTNSKITVVASSATAIRSMALSHWQNRTMYTGWNAAAKRANSSPCAAPRSMSHRIYAKRSSAATLPRY